MWHRPLQDLQRSSGSPMLHVCPRPTSGSRWRNEWLREASSAGRLSCCKSRPYQSSWGEKYCRNVVITTIHIHTLGYGDPKCGNMPVTGSAPPSMIWSIAIVAVSYLNSTCEIMCICHDIYILYYNITLPIYRRKTLFCFNDFWSMIFWGSRTSIMRHHNTHAHMKMRLLKIYKWEHVNTSVNIYMGMDQICRCKISMEFFIPKMVNLSSGCCPVAGPWPATSKIILVMSQDYKQCLIDILGKPFWFAIKIIKTHSLGVPPVHDSQRFHERSLCQLTDDLPSCQSFKWRSQIGKRFIICNVCNSW